MELALDDHVGLARSPSSTSPFLNWKWLAMLVGLSVALAERLGDEVVVQQRRAVAHGLAHVGDGGSGSYSTSISFSASSAMCGLIAATAATAWPL